MLSHTRDFTRHGCTVGARLVTYGQLEDRYVCNVCGGSIVSKARHSKNGSSYYAECAACGGQDFISAWLYDRQAREFPFVVDELPDDLKALFTAAHQPKVTAEQAISELFDF